MFGSYQRAIEIIEGQIALLKQLSETAWEYSAIHAYCDYTSRICCLVETKELLKREWDKEEKAFSEQMADEGRQADRQDAEREAIEREGRLCE